MFCKIIIISVLSIIIIGNILFLNNYITNFYCLKKGSRNNNSNTTSLFLGHDNKNGNLINERSSMIEIFRNISEYTVHITFNEPIHQNVKKLMNGLDRGIVILRLKLEIKAKEYNIYIPTIHFIQVFLKK